MLSPKLKPVFEEALEIFPGGVNSPVRSFAAVGGTPVVFSRALGATLWDDSGRPYGDLVQGWGPHILGHRNPKVEMLVKRQLGRQWSVGAPTPEENQLGRLIQIAMPHLERLRLVNSGTEAVMSALRLARAWTGRPLILKMDGGYHGHSDGLLVRAGSGAAQLAQASSEGVSTSTAAQTISIPFNDLEAVRVALAAYPLQIAAVIVEPVAANMGVVLPQPGYLQGLRDLTRAAGVLLIFDEVITGFRVAKGGAAQRFGVTPDLTCLGKIIGGGLPCGAFGGSRELMDQVAPLGPVYQAGTLSGNPLTMVAGAAVLQQISKPGFYEDLEDRFLAFYEQLEPMVKNLAHERGWGPVVLQSCASLFTVFFSSEEVKDWTSASRCTVKSYSQWFHWMLGRGYFLPPAQFEACFLGQSHDKAWLNRLLRVLKNGGV